MENAKYDNNDENEIEIWAVLMTALFFCIIYLGWQSAGVAICWGGNLRIATANAVRYNKSANSEIGSPRTADFVGSAKQGDWQPKRARTPDRIHVKAKNRD